MTKEILLVEDEESINRGISLKLTKEGYKVYSAETIEKVNELFDSYQNTLSLIICDVGLPDGSGFEFCKKILKLILYQDMIWELMIILQNHLV